MVLSRGKVARGVKIGNVIFLFGMAGASPWVPNIPGIDKPFVVGCLDVLRGAKTGRNIIVVGGGLAGCDVALMLAEEGKKVTIIEMLDEIALGLSASMKKAFFIRLSKQNVEIRTGVHLEEVIDGSVIISDRFATRSEIKGDNIVLATGFTPNRQLFDELLQMPKLEVCAVGDCVEPRTIFDAIHEGYDAAYAFI